MSLDDVRAQLEVVLQTASVRVRFKNWSCRLAAAKQVYQMALELIRRKIKTNR